MTTVAEEADWSDFLTKRWKTGSRIKLCNTIGDMRTNEVDNVQHPLWGSHTTGSPQQITIREDWRQEDINGRLPEKLLNRT